MEQTVAVNACQPQTFNSSNKLFRGTQQMNFGVDFIGDMTFSRMAPWHLTSLLMCHWPRFSILDFSWICKPSNARPQLKAAGHARVMFPSPRLLVDPTSLLFQLKGFQIEDPSDEWLRPQLKEASEVTLSSMNIVMRWEMMMIWWYAIRVFWCIHSFMTPWRFVCSWVCQNRTIILQVLVTSTRQAWFACPKNNSKQEAFLLGLSCMHGALLYASFISSWTETCWMWCIYGLEIRDDGPPPSPPHGLGGSSTGLSRGG